MMYYATFKVNMIWIVDPERYRERLHIILNKIFFGMTKGVEFLTKKVKIGNQDIKLQIWEHNVIDSRFDYLGSTYLKGSNGVIIVYDICKKASLNLVKDWVERVEYTSGDVPILVAGFVPKYWLDKKEDREVDTDEATELVKSLGTNGFIEFDLYDILGENLERMFNGLTDLMSYFWKEKKKKNFF